jgi:AraC-like DNA-binding protein
MSELELILRIATFTELGLLISLLLMHGASNRNYHAAAILLLGVASYVLAPMVTQRWQWGIASYPIILMAILVPALFWYFANTVFNDDAAPHPWTKWLLLATAVMGFGSFCSGAGTGEACQIEQLAIPGWVAQMAKLLWVVAALISTGKDWNADLVEPRRRLRLLVVVGAACYISTILVVEMFLPDKITSTLELINMCGLLLAMSALCLHFLSLSEINVLARMAKPATKVSEQVSPLAKQVLSAMENDRAFATDPLTIKTLADQLRTQPHQLRRVINGELGYRNFNAFINLYRIKEVAQRLELAEYRDTALLTLALDAGFRSLAPFNRTFKEHFGVTPSEFRQNIEA